MSDLDAQWVFFEKVCRWGLAAYARGWRCSFGDAYRDPRATFPYSSPGSYHERRLALDVNAFAPGSRRPVEGLEGWRMLGQLWVQLGGTWGGNFKTGSPGDANHLSWGETGRHPGA